ncbi:MULTISPECIES: recombinase family protein [unclassified Amycolatopsis]|uniref:recombinase family protein n=1 Tax=unclassified Amycolatopsis TaxID=2618356 RepID=UPI00106E6868|nr:MULTISPECIES: recombinase family protein [unclassified Amycolatopsis]
MPPERSPLAAAYYRYSLDGGRSIARQQSESRAWSRSHKIPLRPENEHQDNASASVFGQAKGVVRDGWADFLSDLDTGRFTHALLSEVSRGTRELVEYQALAQICIRHRVLIVADGKMYDPDDAGDAFQLGLNVLLAAQESHRTSKRVRKGVVTSVANGRPPAGRTPFGYFRPLVPDGERVNQVPHEVQGPVFAECAQGFLDGKMTLSDVARRFSEVSSRKWDTNSVRYAFLSPVYIGRRPLETKNARESVPGSWERLISDEQHYALHAALAEPLTKPHGPKPTLLCTGWTACAVCGGPQRRRKDHYVCGRKGCTYWPQEFVDAAVTSAIWCVAYTESMAGILRRIGGFDPEKTTQDAFQAAKSRLADAERNQLEFQQEAAKAGLPAAVVVSTLAGYAAEVKTAQSALAELAAAPADDQDADIRAIVEDVRESAAEWNRETGESREILWQLDTRISDIVSDRVNDLWDSLDLDGRRRLCAAKLTVELSREPGATRVRREPDHRWLSIVPKATGSWDGYLKPSWWPREPVEPGWEEIKLPGEN